MPKLRFALFCILPVLTAVPNFAVAGDAALPGEIIQELPTLHCLGVRWLVAGDDNRNANIMTGYRKAGSAQWNRGLDLFRVDSRGLREANRPPEGETLFAGSIFDLQQDTEYEVKLVLRDPDGGDVERTLRMRTWSEPKTPHGRRTIDVHPGGLQQALKESKPGDILRLHQGVYRGVFRPKSGTPELPIVLTGAGDGEAIFDGKGGTKIIDGYALHDLMFENLTFRNAQWGLTFNEAARITIRRCTITDVDYGFVAGRNGKRQRRIFIADCVMRGRSKWPRSEGIEARRGIQIGGTGHVICHNRISHFADAIDTVPAYPVCAIDIYRNEISECTDDGIELDYSEHNVRCFENRLTNIFQGISAQPAQGGPVYIFRNAMYNVGHSTFKLHNNTSGVLMLHNTSVKNGMPLRLSTSASVTNCISRNNLFVGTTANYAYESSARMRDCDFDYDGFAGTWKLFMKFNGVRYPNIEAIQNSGVAYAHVIRVDPTGLFASGIGTPADLATQCDTKINDLRLSPRNNAIDAGVTLANINDNHAGSAPDLGSYELGQELPLYGPRDQSSFKTGFEWPGRDRREAPVSGFPGFRAAPTAATLAHQPF